MKDFSVHSAKDMPILRTMREKFLAKLRRDVEKRGMKTIASETGLSIPTVWRLCNGKYLGNIPTWNKIEKYYKR